MKGFTLLELIIAISVIGVLSAIAVPGVIQWKNTAQYSNALSNLVGDITIARNTAIRHRAKVKISFYTNGYDISMDGRAIRSRILKGDIKILGDISAVFYGSGRCISETEGFIILTNGQARRKVKINRLGKTEVKKDE